MIWDQAMLAIGLAIVVFVVARLAWPRSTRILHDGRTYYRSDLGIYRDETGTLVRDPQLIAILATQLRRHART